MRQMLAKALRRLAACGVRCVLPAVFFMTAACDRASESEPAPTDTALPDATYVGGQACAGCHSEEADAWRGSHHDLAMQEANAATVLGDFGDAEYRYGDVTTRFLRRDGAFVVSTDGPDGDRDEFEVNHAFGAYPLQQYLVALDGGRLQALDIAWDARPAEAGGQQWFHLHPDEAIDFRDPLHWTGVYLRWNTMCADCHSTDLVKGYDRASNRFDTRFASIDVDCEACHGPGSVHAADPTVPPPALPARTHGWRFAEGERIATRVPETLSREEVETCARCHSLRTQLTDGHEPGMPLLDAYRPSLLDEGLYHADGQIRGEVYVYGSFLQSRMAAAGVTCSDCHEPHSGELRAEGNAVCAQCHLPAAYDTPEHHRHETASAGAQCTACHMRAETFMIVDPRRDHSFRVPRPDLSAATGSPNACSDCHADESSAWAAARIAEWFPEGRSGSEHFGTALHAGRTWALDARERLTALAQDPDTSGIARATALRLLGERLSPADIAVIEQSLEEEGDPLVTLAAIEASAAFSPEVRADLVQRFLTDDRLALRVAAGRALVTARDRLSERRQADLDRAVDEYLAVQAFNGDRPEGALNAATIAAEQGRNADAERILLDAIGRFPFETALKVNLAEIYRETGRESDAEQVLREALESNADDAVVSIALGFALVRDGRADEALAYFEQAAALAPGEPYNQYVLAIATNDAGDTERALELLRASHARFPGHADTLFALATILRDAGEIEEAHRYALRLNEARPGDQAAQALLRQLEQQL